MNLGEEDAFNLSKILLKNGYAVCLTGGDLGDDIRVAWLYAGTEGNFDWSNYDQVVFTSIDYLDDYPEAYHDEYVEDEERE